MATYPGAGNGTTPVTSSISGFVLERGMSQYVLGQLATGATQLPINETNVATEAAPAGATQNSVSVCLSGGVENISPPMVSVEINLSAAPGAGEQFEIQGADTDADAFYITPTNANYTITVFTANNKARVDLSPTGGKFMRVRRTKGANAAGCSVKISRLA